MQPDPAALKTLETSKDPLELSRAAQVLGAAPDAASHQKLATLLRDPAFLDRLDPPAVRAPTPMDLKVWRPLRALRANKAPSANAAIVSLCDDPGWLGDPNRVDLLLEATVNARPPEKKVVDFWRRYTAPDRVHLHVMAGVLVQNGSEPALQLFEELLGDSKHRDEVRRTWLHRWYPLHRTKVEHLESVRRVVASAAVQPAIKIAAVESIFDYKEAWGDMHEPVTLTPHAAASADAKKAMRALAAEAKKGLPLPAELSARIDAVLKTIGSEDKPPPP